jgi:hypothetical protein
MKKLYTAHEIYPKTDHVKRWHSSLALPLKVGCDTWPYYCEHLCEVISQSLEQ